ncbi:uncharacterized protein LOC131954023 [Physella acuta]|uniref:uncharacterized protein LOC131954023 n=1 Tax=Physella acuta TaxID=109671 RepID=UPI0027DDC64B|nr:uncharacterized protein LOC131954023 [Physella acuta]
MDSMLWAVAGILTVLLTSSVRADSLSSSSVYYNTKTTTTTSTCHTSTSPHLPPLAADVTEPSSPLDDIGTLTLTYEPKRIISNVTEFLDINCTFVKNGTRVDKVMAIGIFRIRDKSPNKGKEQLALVGPRALNKTLPKLDLLGELKQDGASFLNVRYKLPLEADLGTFRCKVMAQDKSGEPFTQSARVGIEAETSEPSVERQIEAVRQQLERAIENLSTRLAVVENFEHGINTRISRTLTSLFDAPLQQKSLSFYVSKNNFQDRNTAAATCAMLGGHIAEIENAGELKVIVSFMMVRYKHIDGLLIGAVYDKERWVHHHEVDDPPYLDWWAGEAPVNQTGRCVFLWRAYNWQMASRPCQNDDSVTKFICEISKDEKQTKH